jgi:hypothetical protein
VIFREVIMPWELKMLKGRAPPENG